MITPNHIHPPSLHPSPLSQDVGSKSIPHQVQNAFHLSPFNRDVGSSFSFDRGLEATWWRNWGVSNNRGDRGGESSGIQRLTWGLYSGIIAVHHKKQVMMKVMAHFSSVHLFLSISPIPSALAILNWPTKSSPQSPSAVCWTQHWRVRSHWWIQSNQRWEQLSTVRVSPTKWQWVGVRGFDDEQEDSTTAKCIPPWQRGFNDNEAESTVMKQISWWWCGFHYDDVSCTMTKWIWWLWTGLHCDKADSTMTTTTTKQIWGQPNGFQWQQGRFNNDKAYSSMMKGIQWWQSGFHNDEQDLMAVRWVQHLWKTPSRRVWHLWGTPARQVQHQQDGLEVGSGGFDDTEASWMGEGHWPHHWAEPCSSAFYYTAHMYT